MSRWDPFTLETKSLTALYWTAVGVFVLAFYVTPYLPLIDYHQHVALSAIMARMFDKSAPEHALYDVNYVTYNGGFHLITALLSKVIPPFHAGRVVMSAYPVLFAVAALSVAREAGRPRWYAFLALPIVYSRAMAWGFANWNLTFPVAVLGITWFLRWARGEAAVLPRLLLLSLFCGYGHIFATGCMCLGVAVIQLSRVPELGDSWRGRMVALAKSPLPFLPGLAWCAYAYWYQSKQSFSNWEEANLNGQDDPLWWKIRHILDMAVGNAWDLSDNALLALALGVALLLTFLGAPEPPSSSEKEVLDLRAMRWLFWVFLGCYFVVPKIFMATWFISERFLPIAALFLVGALPLRLLPHRTELRGAAATIGVAAALNTLRLWTTMGDTKDALAILDEVPEGRKLIGVIPHEHNVTERIGREVYVHLPAVYQAKKRGEIAYTFTKFESMPVHYKPGLAPPKVHPAFEWHGEYYDTRHPWCRAYDVTLVRSTDDGDPAVRTFRGEAYKVRALARRGRWYLYDTSALGRTPPTSALED